MSVAEKATKPVVDPLRFSAVDVTGMHRVEFNSVDGHRNVGEVAKSVASAMDLPLNSPWALRSERNARMLKQDIPLGSQVDSDAELVLIPQSHLG